MPGDYPKYSLWRNRKNLRPTQMNMQTKRQKRLLLSYAVFDDPEETKSQRNLAASKNIMTLTTRSPWVNLHWMPHWLLDRVKGADDSIVSCRLLQAFDTALWKENATRVAYRRLSRVLVVRNKKMTSKNWMARVDNWGPRPMPWQHHFAAIEDPKP